MTGLSENNRYTVLSYIIDGYEQIIPIKQKSDRARDIMVTNDPELKDESNTWEVICDETLQGTTFDKCYQIRFDPFRYTDDSIILRIDGCVCVEENLDPIIDKFINSGAEMCLMQHPVRQTIYDEYGAWVNSRDYTQQQADNVLDFMKNVARFNPKTKGLAQLGFIIQKDDHINGCINKITYSFLKLLGDEKTGIERIDQTMFSFVCQKYYPNVKILWVNETMFHGKYLTLYQHNQNTPRGLTPAEYYPEPYFNNKKINTVLSQEDF